nr:helix-turn-helix transcriptional regulator [Tessaracoccus coleopterorum]
MTPTEREILTLMRRGLKNSEIAAERFVTLGTLRSQIKPLYRKLGASDRAAALEAAARLRLLGEG